MKKKGKNNKKVNNFQEIKMIAIIVAIVVFALVVVFVGFNDGKIAKPEIKIEPDAISTEWRKAAIVKIIKEPKSKTRIVGYNYCINNSKSTDDCDWKMTITKNIQVFKNGENYVHIRAVDENEKEGKELLTTIKIDNDGPNISSFNVTNNANGEITVAVDANDDYSNVKYYYSVDDGDYVEGSSVYTYKGLESEKTYILKLKVVDEADNMKTVAIQEKAN